MDGLIKIRPLGIGTADCESFSSYITRLAAENCVGPKILLSGIFDNLGNPHHRGTFGSNELAAIDGPSGRSAFLADRVAEATGIEEVRFLTLHRFSKILGPRQLLAPMRRWVKSELTVSDEACPSYEKLVWRIQNYRFSPSGEPLEHFCPACRRQLGVLRANQRIAQCSYPSCNATLSMAGYSKYPCDEDEGGTYAFWRWASQQMGELVAFGEDLRDVSFNVAFREWLSYFGIKRNRDASNLFGVSHLSIDPWRENRIPDLVNVLNICWCFRTSLLDFLRIRMLPMDDSAGPRESPIASHKRQKPHHRRRIDKVDMEKQLRKILQEDKYPHLSFSKICQNKLDRRVSVVRGYFPDLAKAISARFRERRADSAKITRAGNIAHIKEAAAILRAKRKRVTLKSIKGLLPKPSIMANNWARTAARQEMNP